MSHDAGNLLVNERKAAESSKVRPPPLKWKSTRGGTCHIDSVLELMVAFTASFVDLPEDDESDTEIVHTVRQYINRRRQGANAQEATEIRDRIESMLFKVHPDAYGEIGADAREWLHILFANVFRVQVQVVCLVFEIMIFANVFQVRTGISARHHDGLCVQNCKNCLATSATFATDATLQTISFLHGKAINVAQFMDELSSNEGILRRRGCFRVDLSSDEKACTCIFTYRQLMVTPSPQVIFLETCQGGGRGMSHIPKLQSLDFKMKGQTWFIFGVLIRKPCHWWTYVRSNKVWMCVDPFRKIEVPISPMHLQLPPGYSMVVVATSMLPRDTHSLTPSFVKISCKLVLNIEVVYLLV